MAKKVKTIFNNRITIGFSDSQYDWLLGKVQTGEAENVGQYLRKLVNVDMGVKA